MPLCISLWGEKQCDQGWRGRASLLLVDKKNFVTQMEQTEQSLRWRPPKTSPERTQAVAGRGGSVCPLMELGIEYGTVTAGPPDTTSVWGFNDIEMLDWLNEYKVFYDLSTQQMASLRTLWSHSSEANLITHIVVCSAGQNLPEQWDRCIYPSSMINYVRSLAEQELGGCGEDFWVL